MTFHRFTFHIIQFKRTKKCSHVQQSTFFVKVYSWSLWNIHRFSILVLFPPTFNWLFHSLPFRWWCSDSFQKDYISSKCSNASVVAVFSSTLCETFERKCRRAEDRVLHLYTRVEVTSRFSGRCRQNGRCRTKQPHTPASMRRQYLENYKRKRPLQLHL